MRAPTLYSHKILYVGAAIGRPFDVKVTFVSYCGRKPPPYDFESKILFAGSHIVRRLLHTKKGDHWSPF